MGALEDFYRNNLEQMFASPQDYLIGLTAPGAIYNSWKAYDKTYENSHGGDRYFLSQLPFYGHLKRYFDEKKKAQDEYDAHGRDQVYSSDYGNGGIPGISDIGNTFRPARMVNKLANMYGVEVQLDIAKVRRAGARDFRAGAENLRRYGEMKERNGWR